ncbi:MAG: hypothetical protein Q8R53_03800 [Nanoarchaeota archaeon]|nr:hypothetical protein [Nanoarchaeota archaeon]
MFKNNPDLEARTKFVPMSLVEVTSATDGKPYVGTTSLASCAGIAIYDAEHKVGGVAHAFFNEKESIVVYMRDAQGRAIPSSGRAIVRDNPRPFEPFAYLAGALIRKADEIGGKKYKFMAFNVQHGCRTPAQNEQLKVVVDRTIDTLRQAGKISDFEYRHEQAFRLDTRTGVILPYFF